MIKTSNIKRTAALTDAEKKAILNSPDFTLTSKAEYEGRRLKLYCKQVEVANSGIDNYSEIHWALKVEGGVVKYYAAGPTTIQIGKKVGGSKNTKTWSRTGVADVFPSSKNKVEYGFFEYEHDNVDGSSNPLDMVLTTAIYWGDWNLQTASNTWKLRKVNRQFTQTPELTLLDGGLTETSVAYSWVTSERCSNVSIEVQGKKQEEFEISSIIDAGTKKTGTISIGNLLAGETYDFTIKFEREDSKVPTTVKISTTTYNYPYVVATAVDVIYPPKNNLEETVQSIKVYNPLHRKVTAYMGLIENKIDDESLIIKSMTTTFDEDTYELFYFTQTDIYKHLVTANYANVYYFCKTTIDNVDYMSHKSIIGKISILGTEVPNVSNMSVKWYDSNSKLTTITGQGSPASTSKWLVQNLSKLTVTIDNFATGTGGALIDSYIVYYGKNTKTFLASEMTKSFTLDITGQATNLDLQIAVKDSRGAIAKTNKLSVPIYEYEPPTAWITAKRKNNYGPTVEITYGYKFSSVNGVNGVRVGYWSTLGQSGYFHGGPSTYVTTVTDSKTTSFSDQDNDKSITYSIGIADKLIDALEGDITKTGEARVARGQPIFFIDEEQLGVGVNCFPNGEGLHATTAYVNRIYLSEHSYIEADVDRDYIRFGFKE